MLSRAMGIELLVDRAARGETNVSRLVTDTLGQRDRVVSNYR
jgi:hypothetical protein